MAGKKTLNNGCEWCDGSTFWEHDPDGEGCFLHVGDGKLKIYSPPQCSDFEMHVPISFCPMCGRRF